MYRRITLNLQTATRNLNTGRDSFFFASAFLMRLSQCDLSHCLEQSSNLLMRAKTLRHRSSTPLVSLQFIGGWVSSISPALPGAHPCYSASVQIQCAVDDFFSRTGAQEVEGRAIPSRFYVSGPVVIIIRGSDPSLFPYPKAIKSLKGAL